MADRWWERYFAPTIFILNLPGQVESPDIDATHYYAYDIQVQSGTA